MRPATARSRRTALGIVVLAAIALGACGDGGSGPTATELAGVELVADADHGKPRGDVSSAVLATAAFQDVEVAEAAGYASTIDALGCFTDAARGGMGVHYVNGELMDATLDVARPEALVYELDASGAVVGLVGLEYIVPVEAWTAKQPPRVFGQNLHRHPVLPLWVLHAWVWKTNPDGMHEDWNPAVRPCPAGVPVFGVDRP